MSEVNPQSHVPASGQAADQDPLAVSADASQAPRGKHEDEGNVDDTEGVAGHETPRESASRPIVETETEESLVVHNSADLTADEPEAKAPPTIASPKTSGSVKPPSGKPTGSSATPTVKKARVQRVDAKVVC